MHDLDVAAGGGAALRVLVVDDDPTVRRVATWILEDQGFDVRFAADGLAALAILEQTPFDVVLSDLEMPFDGCSLTDEIKRRFPSVRIVLMSGAVGGAKRCSTAPHSFIAKPFDAGALVSAVTDR